MQRFERQDDAYRRWLRENPSGYVLNIQRTHAPSGVMLHRAICFTIQHESFRGSGWTSGVYVKVCAPAREPLRNWALRRAGITPPDCLKCHP